MRSTHSTSCTDCRRGSEVCKWFWLQTDCVWMWRVGTTKTGLGRSREAETLQDRTAEGLVTEINCWALPAPPSSASVAEDPLPPACDASRQGLEICSCSSSAGNSLFLRSSWFLHNAIKKRRQNHSSTTHRFIFCVHSLNSVAMNFQPLSPYSPSPNFQ